jgi:hypothetical protein
MASQSDLEADIFQHAVSIFKTIEVTQRHDGHTVTTIKEISLRWACASKYMPRPVFEIMTRFDIDQADLSRAALFVGRLLSFAAECGH